MNDEVRRLSVRVEWQHLKRLRINADVIDPVDLRRRPTLAIIPQARDEHVGISFSGTCSTTRPVFLDDPERSSVRRHWSLYPTRWTHNRLTSLPSLSGADTRIKTVYRSVRSGFLFSLSPSRRWNPLRRPVSRASHCDRGSVIVDRGADRSVPILYCSRYTWALVFPRHPIAGRRESHVHKIR